MSAESPRPTYSIDVLFPPESRTVPTSGTSGLKLADLLLPYFSNSDLALLIPRSFDLGDGDFMFSTTNLKLLSLIDGARFSGLKGTNPNSEGCLFLAGVSGLNPGTRLDLPVFCLAKFLLAWTVNDF